MRDLDAYSVPAEGQHRANGGMGCDGTSHEEEASTTRGPWRGAAGAYNCAAVWPGSRPRAGGGGLGDASMRPGPPSHFGHRELSPDDRAGVEVVQPRPRTEPVEVDVALRVALEGIGSSGIEQRGESQFVVPSIRKLQMSIAVHDPSPTSWPSGEIPLVAGRHQTPEEPPLASPSRGTPIPCLREVGAAW